MLLLIRLNFFWIRNPNKPTSWITFLFTFLRCFLFDCVFPHVSSQVEEVPRVFLFLIWQSLCVPSAQSLFWSFIRGCMFLSWSQAGISQLWTVDLQILDFYCWSFFFFQLRFKTKEFLKVGKFLKAGILWDSSGSHNKCTPSSVEHVDFRLLERSVMSVVLDFFPFSDVK